MAEGIGYLIFIAVVGVIFWGPLAIAISIVRYYMQKEKDKPFSIFGTLKNLLINSILAILIFFIVIFLLELL